MACGVASALAGALSVVGGAFSAAFSLGLSLSAWASTSVSHGGSPGSWRGSGEGPAAVDESTTRQRLSTDRPTRCTPADRPVGSVGRWGPHNGSRRYNADVRPAARAAQPLPADRPPRP